MARFTYLGSVIAWNGDTEVDVMCYIGKAIAIFQKMNKFWSLLSMSLKIRFHLFYSIVIPKAIYASKTWEASASTVSTRGSISSSRGVSAES